MCKPELGVEFTLIGIKSDLEFLFKQSKIRVVHDRPGRVDELQGALIYKTIQ